MKKIFLLTVAAIIISHLQPSAAAQESMLCVGAHWTEDEANLMMKEFASLWTDRSSWEERATMIRQGIIEGHAA